MSLGADLTRTLNSYMASVVTVRAEIAALVRLCEEIGRRAGIEEIDGVPLAEWYIRQHVAELRRALEGLENIDPALAAMLQDRVDEARRQAGMDGE